MDNEKATNERAHSLNEKQKQVKQKIMEDCLAGLFGNIHLNRNLFEDVQSVMDLVCSVLVMFNREVLTHLFKSTNTIDIRKEVMKNLFQAVKDEVNEKIKKGMS
jgi:hypothetical protein